MKTLYLLRHAKSSWDDNQLSDAQRPLNKRGKRDSQLIARQLEKQQRKFSHVFCSPATRARETLSRFQSESDVFDGSEIQFVDALYTFDSTELLAAIRNLPQQLDSALIIGHNPALSELAELLCDGKIGHVGTCTYMELAANVEYWDQFRGDCAKVLEILRPKQFR